MEIRLAGVVGVVVFIVFPNEFSFPRRSAKSRRRETRKVERFLDFLSS